MITDKKTPYLFLLPYIVLFTVFIIIPTGMAVLLSCSPRTPSSCSTCCPIRWCSPSS